MTWDSVDSIDWDLLPSSFVIKCNHDSGGIIICKDKSALNIRKAKELLSYHLSHDNYSITREWPYKNVQKRLLCEPYIEDSDTGELRDYKFFCFNGEPKVLFIATDRSNPNTETKFDVFDMSFNHLPLEYIHPNSNKAIEKPKCFDEMVLIARKLSEGFPHVRVDLYQVNNKVLFGELTFFSGSGFGSFNPSKYDDEWGDWILLPEEKLI